jgi:hypothetical protein
MPRAATATLDPEIDELTRPRPDERLSIRDAAVEAFARRGRLAADISRAGITAEVSVP